MATKIIQLIYAVQGILDLTFFSDVLNIYLVFKINGGAYILGHPV